MRLATSSHGYARASSASWPSRLAKGLQRIARASQDSWSPTLASTLQAIARASVAAWDLVIADSSQVIARASVASCPTMLAVKLIGIYTGSYGVLVFDALPAACIHLHRRPRLHGRRWWSELADDCAGLRGFKVLDVRQQLAHTCILRPPTLANSGQLIAPAYIASGSSMLANSLQSIARRARLHPRLHRHRCFPEACSSLHGFARCQARRCLPQVLDKCTGFPGFTVSDACQPLERSRRVMATCCS